MLDKCHWCLTKYYHIAFELKMLYQHGWYTWIACSSCGKCAIAMCVNFNLRKHCCLTHWGRMTHICVSKLAIIGSDNGLSPDRRQAIIWTNAGLLLIWPLGTNFSEILTGILTFSFKKMRLKVSSADRWPFCIGFNVLRVIHQTGRGCVFQLKSVSSPSFHFMVTSQGC